MTGIEVLEAHGKSFKDFIDFIFTPEPNSFDPLLGFQIEFLERNGFDFGDDMNGYGAWFYQDVNTYCFPDQLDYYYLRTDFSGKRLSDEEIRLVGIDVRNLFRQKFGLPPLTQVEADNWVLHLEMSNDNDLKVSLRSERLQKFNDESPLESVRPSIEQARKVLQCFQSRYPSYYCLYVAIRDLAKPQGYDAVTDGVNFNWVSQHSYRLAINQCVEICFGPELKRNEIMDAWDFEEIWQEA